MTLKFYSPIPETRRKTFFFFFKVIHAVIFNLLFAQSGLSARAAKHANSGSARHHVSSRPVDLTGTFDSFKNTR